MAAKKHTILIAGASGVVGKAATEYFAALPDWQVLALSRRPFDLPEGVQHVPVDLCDAQACQSAAANLTHVTHVLFAASDTGAIDWQFMGVHRPRIRLRPDASRPFRAQPHQAASAWLSWVHGYRRFSA